MTSANYLESVYTIRFSDCDPFKHLNNARYIDYFLNAREDHLRDHYQLDLAQEAMKGQAWVVKEHSISYVRPAVYNEIVSISTALIEVNADNLLVEMVMFDAPKRQLKALLHTRFVSINSLNGKRSPHSKEFMDFLSDKVASVNADGFDIDSRVQYWLNAN